MNAIDPRIVRYFRLNSAAIPLRAIAITDARVHITIDPEKKWLTQTPVGAVAAETVIGGGAGASADTPTRILVI